MYDEVKTKLRHIMVTISILFQRLFLGDTVSTVSPSPAAQRPRQFQCHCIHFALQGLNQPVQVVTIVTGIRDRIQLSWIRFLSHSNGEHLNRPPSPLLNRLLQLPRRSRSTVRQVDDDPTNSLLGLGQ